MSAKDGKNRGELLAGQRLARPHFAHLSQDDRGLFWHVEAGLLGDPVRVLANNGRVELGSTTVAAVGLDAEDEALEHCLLFS